METKPQGGPQLAQGWAQRRSLKLEMPPLELLSPTAFRRQLGSDLPFSCVCSRIRQEPTTICCDPDEAFHRSISGRVDDHQETGLLQAGAKREDPFPLRGHETSLLRRERHNQARPLLHRFLQPGRTIPPEFVLTECVQGAAEAELISRIVRGGTMPPLRRLSPAEDLLNAVRHERFPSSWVASDPTEDNSTVAPTRGSARHVKCSHQFEPWEAQPLDQSDAGLGEAESHLIGPVHGLRHQVCHGAKRCFRGVAKNMQF
ncbi:hypothetical protein T03_15792 [Trichinella britovi]|uniref:Uncharacterized protein n=1 Tax=Trichinella britovi TaxID=45882 RepID=A0A0V1C8D0_TRIBR|nr:hypothetical protein T03_15792 [Trichinella britovi]